MAKKLAFKDPPSLKFHNRTDIYMCLICLLFLLGALSIIGYKYMLQGGQGDPSTLLAVAAVFAIPLILGFVFVTSRSAVNGELAVNKIVRGDFR